MESSFYFLGVYKFFFAPLKRPHTKYYSSLDAFVTLAICLGVLWVRRGKMCVWGEYSGKAREFDRLVSLHKRIISSVTINFGILGMCTTI